MKNAEYYIWLVKCMGVGNARSHKIFEIYDDIAEFYEDCKNKCVRKGVRLTTDEMRFLYETSIEDIAFVFKIYSKFKAQFITIEDEIYPQQLRNIDNPPLILFVVGDIAHLEDELLFTIVGTRKESLYGRRACELLCSELCVSGFSIVSGLANGGDTTAHLTALKCGARTYGFLACGLDIDYPYGKADLKNRIYKNGAIITEFLPGTEAFKQNFHIRNRLMSGLSVGTLVIESPKRSGTLITAHQAVNQGKDVFAVPAGIFWKNSAGIIELIQNGAKPVKDALDIIEEYLPIYPEKIKIPEERFNIAKILDVNNKLGLDNENSPAAVDEDGYKKIRKEAKKELKAAAKEAIKSKAEVTEELNVAPAVSLNERLKQSNLDANESAIKIIETLTLNPCTVDELAEKTAMNMSQIMVLTTKLEMAGVVRKIPGNRIEIVE